MSKIMIDNWSEKSVSGGGWTTVGLAEGGYDRFISMGKDETQYSYERLEGTWWELVCLARNILACENTKRACPEFYHPEMRADPQHCPMPYKRIRPKEDEWHE